MRTRKDFLLPVLLAIACIFSFVASANASIRYSDVPVSDAGTDNDISGSNTGRKITVAPNGDIYAVYYGNSQGIRFVRSTNGGTSFLPSVAIDNSASDVEVTYDSEGIIYVVWIKSGVIMLARSLNGGVSFQSPIEVAESETSSVHISVASPYVYIINREGTTLYVNNNKGIGGFTQTIVDSIRVFADVHADPLTGYVYVQTDDPNVLYFISTNHGQTFSPSIRPGADIYYSTAAFSTTASKKYLYVAGGANGGSASDALRVNLNDNSFFQMPLTVMWATQRRSLAADNLGNVVGGFYDGSGVSFEASTDYGENFTAPVQVAAGNFMNVAINPTNQDVLTMYEKDGSIYLSTYRNVLRHELAPDATATFSNNSIDPSLLLPPRIADIRFSINKGQTATASSEVILDIAAGSDVRSMAISPTADFAGISIQSLASSANWKICDQCVNGESYTVFLKLYTASGQSLTLSRSIRYENAALLATPTLNKEPPPTSPLPPVFLPFLTDLRLNSRSADVRRLQQYLNTHGFLVAKNGPGSPGQEIDLFGKATRAALMRFQAAHAKEILKPYGLKSPSGIFGSSTRGYINNNL